MLQGAWIPITYIKHFRTRASMSGIILKTVGFVFSCITVISPRKTYSQWNSRFPMVTQNFQDNTVIINTEGEWQKLLNKVRNLK